MTSERLTGIDKVRDLVTRRGRIVIPFEDLFRLVEANPEYVVLGVHTRFDPEQVAVIVAHPDLPVTAEGCESPTVPVELGSWTDVRVVDGELYRRAHLEIGPPGELGLPVTARIREQLRDRLQAVLDTYAPEHQLEGLLVTLAEAAALPETPFSAESFLGLLQ